MLEFLDNIFRYGGVSLFLWIGGMLLYYACGRLQARIGAYTAFTTAAYLISSDHTFWQIFGGYAKFLVPFCVLNIGLIWLFCVSLFDDDLKLKPIHYLIPATFFVAGIPFVLGLGAHPILGDGLIDKLITIGRALIIVHMVFIAWKGRDIDLIEKRREFRMLFVGIVTVISCVILVVETFFPTNQIGADLKLLQSFAFMLVALGILSRISLIETDALFMPEPTTPKLSDEMGTELCRPEDEHNLMVLAQLMSEGMYREPGLTTAMLAEKSRMPEHRMRQLINKHMGYRNFADYLNHHRIEEAKRMLESINDRHIPILSIAMDLGYLSLGPFNKAFKERTGLTPTAYRREKLLLDSSNVENTEIYIK
jgi:AraC-like DNA-binding protein